MHLLGMHRLGMHRDSLDWLGGRSGVVGLGLRVSRILDNDDVLCWSSEVGRLALLFRLLPEGVPNPQEVDLKTQEYEESNEVPSCETRGEAYYIKYEVDDIGDEATHEGDGPCACLEVSAGRHNGWDEAEDRKEEDNPCESNDHIFSILANVSKVNCDRNKKSEDEVENTDDPIIDHNADHSLAQCTPTTASFWQAHFIYSKWQLDIYSSLISELCSLELLRAS